MGYVNAFAGLETQIWLSVPAKRKAAVWWLQFDDLPLLSVSFRLLKVLTAEFLYYRLPYM